MCLLNHNYSEIKFKKCPLVKLSFPSKYQTLMIGFTMFVYLLVAVDHG